MLFWSRTASFLAGPWALPSPLGHRNWVPLSLSLCKTDTTAEQVKHEHHVKCGTCKIFILTLWTKFVMSWPSVQHPSKLWRWNCCPSPKICFLSSFFPLTCLWQLFVWALFCSVPSCNFLLPILSAIAALLRQGLWPVSAYVQIFFFSCVCKNVQIGPN